MWSKKSHEREPIPLIEAKIEQVSYPSLIARADDSASKHDPF